MGVARGRKRWYYDGVIVLTLFRFDMKEKWTDRPKAKQSWSVNAEAAALFFYAHIKVHIFDRLYEGGRSRIWYERSNKRCNQA